MRGEQDLIEAIKQNLVDSGCSKKQIEDLAREKFGDLAGLAQEYLFYGRREA